jgi:aminoglycoside phosphotransferase (APT) family kinase protein
VTSARGATLNERERNRLLRRVDWRFLLTAPVPRRVLCLAGGELRVSCGMIAEAAGDTLTEDAGPYDLVVLADPSSAMLADALGRLRTGGEVYAEWSDASGDAVRDVLESVGFFDIRCYWPWPAPPNAEVWVPLDAPWAFDYFVRTDRHVYSGLRHRLGTRARRFIARQRLSAKRGTPLCAIARKPGANDRARPRRSDVIETLKGQLRQSGELTVALLTGGPRSISKVVGVVYGSEAHEPAAIVKWPRVHDSQAGLANEAAVLEACHARVSVPGIPRVLVTSGAGATLAVAETPAPGAPLFATLTSANFPQRSRAGAQWLGDFHSAQRSAPLAADRLTARADAAVSRLRATFGDVIDPGLLDDTTTLLRELRDVPTVVEHRDYGPWNIFLDATGQLSVLDWESSRVEGLPLLDLLYFITYMAFFMDGAMVSRRFVESYRASLHPRTATGTMRRELVEGYAAQFGINVAAQHALRALCWIEHAESEFLAFTTDAGGRPPAAALGESVFAKLWAEEIIDLRR